MEIQDMNRVMKKLEAVGVNVSPHSDLFRYLYRLEFNNISYHLNVNYNFWIEVLPDYANGKFIFNKNSGKQLNYLDSRKNSNMKTIKRWWVFWYAETPWRTYSEGSRFFENEDAAEAFCEAMLEDKDVYKVRIEEHLT